MFKKEDIFFYLTFIVYCKTIKIFLHRRHVVDQNWKPPSVGALQTVHHVAIHLFAIHVQLEKLGLILEMNLANVAIAVVYTILYLLLQELISSMQEEYQLIIWVIAAWIYFVHVALQFKISENLNLLEQNAKLEKRIPSM